MRAIKRLKQASTRPSDEARYAYAPAGNPVERAELGFETTNAFNNLNQILSGSWTGSTITAVGAVNYPAGTVTVSGASGTIYADKTFDAAGVPVSPGANTLTNVFTDVFGRSVTNATSVTIANRAYVHDANGNLTSDGVFQYQYDAANQLTNVVRLADGACVLSARYDALGRRVEATRADGSVERYVYFPGSFLVLAVLDGSNAIKEVYTRGPDLSGSLDGAGGIGGILACTYASGATYCSHADIMGNVIALTDASGSVAATFRYTPFGQLSARTGMLLPRYLFSSKEFDRAANLYYYGYRYYAPRMGRWMTRDRIAEQGGIQLYAFGLNNPCSKVDFLGLTSQVSAKQSWNKDDPMRMLLRVKAHNIKEGCELNFIQLVQKENGWEVDARPSTSFPPNPPFYYDRDWHGVDQKGVDDRYLAEDGTLTFEDQPTSNTHFYLFAVERCCTKYYNNCRHCSCCIESTARVLGRIHWSNTNGKAVVHKQNDLIKQSMDTALRKAIHGKNFPVTNCEPYNQDKSREGFNFENWKFMTQKVNLVFND